MQQVPGNHIYTQQLLNTFAQSIPRDIKMRISTHYFLNAQRVYPCALDANKLYLRKVVHNWLFACAISVTQLQKVPKVYTYAQWLLIGSLHVLQIPRDFTQAQQLVICFSRSQLVLSIRIKFLQAIFIQCVPNSRCLYSDLEN